MQFIFNTGTNVWEAVHRLGISGKHLQIYSLACLG